MNILYLYQYFSTPNGSWGTRVHDFATEWVKKGHKVTVVTSIYYKSDLRSKKFIEEKYFNGIRVIIINILISNKHNKFKRILNFIIYSFFATYFTLRIKNDVIIASSGPITISIPVLIVNFFFKKKFVFEVRDLWPQLPIDLGIIRNSFIKKLSYWLEKQCYLKSKLIISLSPGIEEYIRKHYPKSKVVTVTNSCDNELFDDSININSNKLLNLPENYAIYAGNVGSINNPMLLFNAAKYLKEKIGNEIHILVAGDGQDKEKIKKISKDQKIDNLLFLELLSKKEVAFLLKKSIASIIPLKGSSYLDCSSPNKLFEAFAAGTPVIQTTNGWIKNYLNHHKIGYTIGEDDFRELAEKIIYLKNNIQIRNEINRKAKKISNYDFDKKILSQKMIDNILFNIL